jgi:hypothetical protein
LLLLLMLSLTLKTETLSYLIRIENTECTCIVVEIHGETASVPVGIVVDGSDGGVRRARSPDRISLERNRSLLSRNRGVEGRALVCCFLNSIKWKYPCL